MEGMTMKVKNIIFSLGVAAAGSCFSVQAAESQNLQTLGGKVVIDGSSTVFPISEAVAEEFQKENATVKVSLASSGTGGGFKKFCKGEIDITGASRPIELSPKAVEPGKTPDKSEFENCNANKVSFVELPVAFDGIAVVVNKANTWAKTLSVAELKRIWEPGSKITKWSEVRAGFPNTKISLYGPGAEHGTFDYFTHAIVGKEKSIRTDFNAANPDALVTAVKRDKNALAYFGFAYYVQNKAGLSVVAIESAAGKKAVTPSESTIRSGEYLPLSRPLFLYVAEASLARPEVTAFANYFIKAASSVAGAVGYAPLQPAVYALVQKRLDTRALGSMYSIANSKSLSISELLASSAMKPSAASTK